MTVTQFSFVKAIGVRNAQIKVAVALAVLAVVKIVTLAIAVEKLVIGLVTAQSLLTGDRGTEVAMAGMEVDAVDLMIEVISILVAEDVAILTEERLK